MPPHLSLTVLPDEHVVAQLPADDPIPPWLPTSGLVSVTRTATELSVVSPAAAVGAGVRRLERGWRVIRFEGPFDFSLTGVLVSVADPLAAAGVGIFAVSTFDTDYVLVKEADLELACAALAAAGHTIVG